MRFYASHACFVDLQRCLCTHQRHTSRLPSPHSLLILFLLLFCRDPCSGRSNRRPNDEQLSPRDSPFREQPSLSPSCYIFSRCHLVTSRGTRRLRYKVSEKRRALLLLSQAGANHRFLNTRPQGPPIPELIAAVKYVLLIPSSVFLVPASRVTLFQFENQKGVFIVRYVSRL